MRGKISGGMGIGMRGGVVQNRFFMNVICFVLWVSSGFPLLSCRLISLPLLIAVWWACFSFRRSRRFLRVLVLWILLMLSSFSPVDISFKNYPGPPHLVPLVMGLPIGETWERAERHEIILGGCVVTGHEPKYVLVW